MSALTEFLLARVAEEETGAHSGRTFIRAGVIPSYFSSDGITFIGPGYQTNPAPDHLLERLRETWAANREAAKYELAQVASTRAIVDHARLWSSDTRRDQYAEGVRYGADIVLHQLAQPYSDHPDFRPEWRL